METGLKQDRLWISEWVCGALVLLCMKWYCAVETAKGVARSGFHCAASDDQADSFALAPSALRAASRERILAGVDADSTYCYLLAAEDHGDDDTWGVHLLEPAQPGLAPEYTIADARIYGRYFRARLHPIEATAFIPLIASPSLRLGV